MFKSDKMEQLVDSYSVHKPTRQLLETQNKKTVIRGIKTIAWPQVFFLLVFGSFFIEGGSAFFIKMFPGILSPKFPQE